MPEINMSSRDYSILRKLLPIICLFVPWEIYYYTAQFSKGWGIKFSLFYANFDTQYGTLFVDIVKQLELLSSGGFLPSVRTITWFIAATLCVILVVYELFGKELDFKVKESSIAAIFISCAILTSISSLSVWNDAFKTIPIAPFFFLAGGYLLSHTNKSK
jgi:hypothetical protein